jgi:two-component system cell cycle sensor histidine kinase/response regulator CckA
MDLSDEKRTPSGPAAEESLLQTLVSVFVFDAAGVVLDVNRTGAALVRADRDRLIGRPFAELLVDADETLLTDHIARVLAAGERRVVELRMKGRGPASHLRLESIARAEDGATASVLSVLVDVTEHRQLQEQLNQAQKMEAMGRLAGGVAHDFNNVLMAIMGYTDLLLLRLAPRDESRSAVEMIQKTAERAQSLTRQLVAFSRKQVIEHRSVNLNTVVKETTKLLKRVLGEDVEVIPALAADLSLVKADPGQLQQVLMNLALNARDAMPRGGRLVIETADREVDEALAARTVRLRPGPHVVLTVSDTGVGIDPDVLPHIFEPFYTTKPIGKGTGLGLSTVFGIVEQGDGHVQVESVPGAGTTFTVYLPALKESARRAAKKAERPERAALPRGSETILVVEDEPAVRETVTEILKTTGYSVLSAGHAGEALLVCERHDGPIHLMLTDVVMPGMGGRELAQRLTQMRPDMQVLYMSGHTDDAILRHGVRDALYSFIQKPFTMDVLARKIRALLDGRAGL